MSKIGHTHFKNFAGNAARFLKCVWPFWGRVNIINPAYTKATKPVEKIVLENASFLKNTFNLEVTEIIKKLPLYNGLLNYIKILPQQGL